MSVEPAGAAETSTTVARCPLDGERLYAWIAVPSDPAAASVGTPVDERGGGRVLERCERCGVALERGATVDPIGEWDALTRNGMPFAVPNRASLQAALGEAGWAGLSHAHGALLLTPRSVELLADHASAAPVCVRFPAFGRSQRWMWQTLLNGLTFHANFAREVRAGRLRPATARSRLAFAIDAAVTVLAAPLVAVVSVPLEAIAALARRGGEIVVERG